MANSTLSKAKAKAAKKDEFYTQFFKQVFKISPLHQI